MLALIRILLRSDANSMKIGCNHASSTHVVLPLESLLQERLKSPPHQIGRESIQKERAEILGSDPGIDYGSQSRWIGGLNRRSARCL